jgi:hypothetical protein
MDIWYIFSHLEHIFPRFGMFHKEKPGNPGAKEKATDGKGRR